MNRPHGVPADAVPVAVLLAGTWQTLWVLPDDVESTVVNLHTLGYSVTSKLEDVTPKPAPKPEPFRLFIVK